MFCNSLLAWKCSLTQICLKYSFGMRNADTMVHVPQVSGQIDSNATSPDHHAMFPVGPGGKRIHPVAYSDATSDIGSPGEPI